MSKVADKLRVIKIYNDHGISEPGGVYISRRSRGPWKPPAWIVHIQGKSFKTAGREDNGGRAFRIEGRGDVKDCLARAIDWCQQNLGTYYFVKSPFGGGNMVQESFLKKAIKKADDVLA